MKHRIFALCTLFAGLATMAQAQAQGSFTMKCNPTLVNYQFSATQQISTFTCTTDATVNGVAFNGLTFSETSQVTTSGGDSWGVIVGALANGGQVFFQFTAVAHKASSTSGTAQMSYKIVGGTGTANGITGSGTCNATEGQGTGSEQTCVGTYTTH